MIVLSPTESCAQKPESEKHECSFYLCSDLNDRVGGLSGQGHTPNLDKLFSQGVLFTNEINQYDLSKIDILKQTIDSTQTTRT